MRYSPSADLRRYKIRKKPSLFDFFSNLHITRLLIIFNILFFILFLIMGFGSDADCNKSLCKSIALTPNNLFEDNYWWTLISSMFMHAGWMHLLVNMFSLYFVGSFLEMLIGRKRFFWFYILSGIFAGLFFALFSYFLGNNGGILENIFGNPAISALGASGAIFALAGVLAVLTPKNKVYLIAGPLIAIILEYIFIAAFNLTNFVSGLLDFIVFFYVIISLFSLVSFNDNLKKISLPVKIPLWVLPLVAIVPLILIGIFINLPIGNMAHLGGFIAGILYGFYLRFKYKNKTVMIAKYFSR